MNISIHDLTFVRNGKTLLNRLDCTFADASVTAIIGRNGCGKSTLLKLLAGLLKPASGTIAYDGRNIADFSPEMLARRRAILLQSPHVPQEMSVSELLTLGRYAFDTGKKYDAQAVGKALADTGCEAIAGRKLATLSGGELRKVFLAMALAQEPELLLLDEVEAGLDADFCSKLPAMLARLIRERHLTVIMVMHDLDLALHCATDIVGIADGQLKLAVKNSAGAIDQLNAFASGSMHISAADDGTLNAKLNYLK